MQLKTRRLRTIKIWHSKQCECRLIKGEIGKMEIVMFLDNEQIQKALLVQKGHTNAEIGDKLGYSADCIKKRLKKIYNLVGVKRRVEFVKYLTLNGIL